jgi:L-ascorbate metabolism protein UlaG (beta-lactamase superfamily)
MRVTKYTHSCVRLEFDDGGVLVIDPGTWSEAHALSGAHAVLVTHEHADHIDVPLLAGLGVPVYAPAGAAIAGVPFTGLAAGDEFTAAGARITAVGGRHAICYGHEPDCPNLGYIVDGRLYHPGDALHVPGQPVETLLIPMHAAWLKTAEAIDFARAVKPERAFGIHDAQLNERGTAGVNAWFARTTGTGYRWLAPGDLL